LAIVSDCPERHGPQAIILHVLDLQQESAWCQKLSNSQQGLADLRAGPHNIRSQNDVERMRLKLTGQKFLTDVELSILNAGESLESLSGLGECLRRFVSEYVRRSMPRHERKHERSPSADPQLQDTERPLCRKKAYQRDDCSLK
jgi:Tfp pilus assembly protein PilN